MGIDLKAVASLQISETLMCHVSRVKTKLVVPSTSICPTLAARARRTWKNEATSCQSNGFGFGPVRTLWCNPLPIGGDRRASLRLFPGSQPSAHRANHR